ncbi:MAG: zinc-binding dehydrogenase [Opitutae bacterium]|nr:zinc-binding dehydrogenase [Opitutae bacterium]
MNVPSTGRAVCYHEYGDPRDVLQLEEMPVPEVGAGEVLVEMQATTIHPSDLGLINGSYGRLRDLPAVAGREGVGTVVSVGSGVDEKVVGRPVALPDDQGTWQDYVKAQADDLILLPALVPFDQLAVSILNPLTAWRLLNDFEYLKEGDFVIQNAGNSAVGLSVIQFAKKIGINLISLVRSEERRLELIDFGAGEVWIDDDEVPDRTKELTNGKGCALGLNSVGGRSALRLARSLGQGGVHVTFGAMDSSPVRFPTRSLIFDDVRFVGFWLDKWKRKQSPGSLRNAIEEVLQPLALAEIRHPVDKVFGLDEFDQALARNGESRMGKVLLVRRKDSGCDASL